MCKLLLYGFNISYSFKLFIVLSSVSANELKLFVNERSERASCLTIFHFNSILLLTGFFCHAQSNICLFEDINFDLFCYKIFPNSSRSLFSTFWSLAYKPMLNHFKFEVEFWPIAEKNNIHNFRVSFKTNFMIIYCEINPQMIKNRSSFFLGL